MCALPPLGEHAHTPVELVWRVGVFWQSRCTFHGGDELLWDSLVPARANVGISRVGLRFRRAGLGGWLLTQEQ